MVGARRVYASATRSAEEEMNLLRGVPADASGVAPPDSMGRCAAPPVAILDSRRSENEKRGGEKDTADNERGAER